jgi:hypothetical protein
VTPTSRGFPITVVLTLAGALGLGLFVVFSFGGRFGLGLLQLNKDARQALQISRPPDAAHPDTPFFPMMVRSTHKYVPPFCPHTGPEKDMSKPTP